MKRGFLKALALTMAIMLAPSMALYAQGRGGGNGGGGGGGGEVDDTGNNLSLPVIWADGFALPLRGVYGSPQFDGEAFPTGCESLGVDCWYLQHDPLNAWQAETLVNSATLAVHWIDWGDNLEAKPWDVTSVVRTEVVLYQDLMTPMTGFTMAHLWGQGPDEMWGCNTVQYPSYQATVYSRCARFTIQRLLKAPTDPDFSVTWNPLLGQWQGDANSPTFNGPVWTGEYSAENNVPGKIIYGYNWNVRKDGEGAGVYRLTFSLDSINCPLALNTLFAQGVTQIVPSIEGELAAAAAPGGGLAAIDFANNLTYIDVTILPKSAGGGKKPR